MKLRGSTRSFISLADLRSARSFWLVQSGEAPSQPIGLQETGREVEVPLADGLDPHDRVRRCPLQEFPELMAKELDGRAVADLEVLAVLQPTDPAAAADDAVEQLGEDVAHGGALGLTELVPPLFEVVLRAQYLLSRADKLDVDCGRHQVGGERQFKRRRLIPPCLLDDDEEDRSTLGECHFHAIAQLRTGQVDVDQVDGCDINGHRNSKG